MAGSLDFTRFNATKEARLLNTGSLKYLCRGIELSKTGRPLHCLLVRSNMALTSSFLVQPSSTHSVIAVFSAGPLQNHIREGMQVMPLRCLLGARLISPRIVVQLPAGRARKARTRRTTRALLSSDEAGSGYKKKEELHIENFFFKKKTGKKQDYIERSTKDLIWRADQMLLRCGYISFFINCIFRIALIQNARRHIL